MEQSLHRFIRLLRLRGMRISVPEMLDAMRAAALPHVLADRQLLREVLRVSLVKDCADDQVFDEVFDLYFSLVRVNPNDGGHGHGHGHDDLSDTGHLDSFTLSEEPGQLPQQGHEHGAPSDIREYFDPDDLATQYNLHQEANKIDLASLTDEIVFSQDATSVLGEGNRVQIETDHLRGAVAPGSLSTTTGTRVDADLSIAEQDALFGWLDDVPDTPQGDVQDEANELRQRLAGVLANLPAALKKHLESLLALEDRVIEGREDAVAKVDHVGERERAELEETLRRLAHSLHGALTHRRKVGARGRVDSSRTMRRNMRYDGVPFRPVTVQRSEDKPRLVLLTDVSLSVRATARFTLHLVHGLQDLVSQVRTFVFVSELAEVTELFSDYSVEHALGLVFGGTVLDVDANSDHGAAFGQFLEEFGNAVGRRTTVLVLADGRSNGLDPNIEAFAEITRRARETIWLTPEPRYSWGLGACDLPLYAEYCQRVRVVRDLSGLTSAAEDLANEQVGR
ncbi:VWA domain-containing protein (plasmid) [Rhodococcus sp. ZPP]|uniref:VWA domain-containing protein n=1 Tax=Rhodococcus TaxID=1827 RepID=UPI001AD86FAD|nr:MULTISPECIES: VWA domain-containing protein [Rhodococcus]MBO8150807.1 VWA domain-containing protein [Rhodococcus erythropolis]QTJ70974.1 VWA domain-containing protein [Rhodococcus sp. ZPP]